MPLRWLQRVRRHQVVPRIAALRAGVPVDALLPLTPADLETADLVAAPVDSYWLERPLGDEWLAAYQFTVQDGLTVISELRIFPIEDPVDRAVGPDFLLAEGHPARIPGQWSAELLGSRASAPRGGLKARLVRLRVGELLRQARADLERLRREVPGLFEPNDMYAPFTAAAARRALTEPRLGRKGHGLPYFAALAGEYVERVRAGDARPAVTIARRRGLTPARVRDLILRARQRGLLTPAVQGQTGGELTPKARAILAVAARENVHRAKPPARPKTQNPRRRRPRR